ncbi:unnamed protein product [Staurois parvus]|uniref:Uncharacterized protein n=1 Tax=Staurois parvus TaxID=386267 RepID=A0ABN9EGH5_9NEOB|nr:unnamed protein product [Staurois parvus]
MLAASVQSLSWVPVRPPIAAVSIATLCCHVPLSGLFTLLGVFNFLTLGVQYGLPLLLSPSPHSAMCHFQVSSHCWCV